MSFDKINPLTNKRAGYPSILIKFIDKFSYIS